MPTAITIATAPRTATTYPKDTTAPANRVIYSAGNTECTRIGQNMLFSFIVTGKFYPKSPFLCFSF